jgi:COP9 signalosome complex subunit 4
MLYKDERTSQLGNLYSMLEKVYMDRLLLPDEVKLFETRLSEHHMALLSDNSTVLDRAVLEHNLLSVSRLYDYIRVDALARFLGVDKNRAESVAARMMAEGRMHGSIDQVEQLISFERAPTSEKSRQNEEATGVSGSAETSQALSQLLSSSSSTRAFSRWNEKLLALCTQIEDIAGAIIEKHPELARA